MEDSKKLDFQRRLSQCNKGEMIVIMYDILIVYLKDAQLAYEEKNHEGYKEALKKAQNTLDMLMGALDFAYPISKDLFRLYMVCKNQLARAIYENRTDGILETQDIIGPLYEAFVAVAKEDTSAPLMRNTQQVYAGMTYGKTSLNETYQSETNRGFLA